MAKLFHHTEGYREGKFLVVRRDGTIPSWPHFVISGDDACAAVALRAYADQAERLDWDAEYVRSVRLLADEFAARRCNPKSDPEAPPHRKDNPAIIAMMRGEGDLSDYKGAE